uniref:Peptidase S1 domain-containing protein n=1 Tax=Myotis lucifugus TaxID=59463 RepID=G1PEJ1_MYOLU
RIVGGTQVEEGEWPWQVSLQLDGIHRCGATLINGSWLVSAAHCFRMYKDPTRWTASFGVTLFPSKMKQGIRRVIVHEKYKYPSHDYDISVAELSSPVPYTNAVHRVCLPDASYEFRPGDEMFVTGFGALQNDALGGSQNHLRQVQVNLIDTETCNKPQSYNNTITPRMLCAGSLEGKRDACQGDSGGPLVSADARDIWYLAGIVSWGDECGQPNKPGVYTRVTALRDWIASQTGIINVHTLPTPALAPLPPKSPDWPDPSIPIFEIPYSSLSLLSLFPMEKRPEKPSCGSRLCLFCRNRIVNGGDAQTGAWPWQASMQWKGQHNCGASLISSRWLLSAAHCFTHQRSYMHTRGPLWGPLAWPAGGSQIVRGHSHLPLHALLHPLSGPGVHNDIALVQLAKEVSFSKYVRKICLPEAKMKLADNDSVVVTGWGTLYMNGPFPNILQEALVKIIDNKVCNAPHALSGLVTDNMLCAGFMSGKTDACQNDSGGPLVYPDSRNIWHLVGIVSWGDGCAKKNKPGVYTRVTAYRDWITSSLNSEPFMAAPGSTSRMLAKVACQSSSCITVPKTLPSRMLDNSISQPLGLPLLFPVSNRSALSTTVSPDSNSVTAHILLMANGLMPATYDRVKGGSNVREGEWPWQASLKINGRHYCGASLISDRYLVTAAHCFQKTLNPKNYTVSFGTKVTPPYMQHYVQQIIIHENYIPGEHHDDIAVVLLTEKVLFKNDVHRVCLPEATQIFLPGEGVVVTGWGALSYNGKYPTILQKAPVKIIDTNTCNSREAYNGMVQDTMLCAGYMEGHIDACQGDSGGPLVYPNSRHIWYLVGIVSWGVECGKINKPGVYMRVTAYRNWIASKTGI